MANEVKWTAGGLDGVHVGCRGASGFMAGFSNLTAASVGLGSGMRKIPAKTAPLPIPPPVVKPVLADDGVLDNFTYASADPNQGILEVSTFDKTIENAVEGKTSVAVGIYTFSGRGGAIGNPQKMMVLLTRQAHSLDSGSAVAGFENELVLDVSMKPFGDESKAHQGDANNRIQCTFNDAPLTFWGALMSGGSVFSIAKQMSVVWFSQYRSMLHLFVGDGSLAETTALDYTPVDAASTKAWNFATGAALTVSSVNTTTKTVTLSAAPASGVLVAILYQTRVFG